MIAQSEGISIEIGGDESVVIFDANGEPRIMMPTGPDNEFVNEGSIWALRVATLWGCPTLKQMVDAEIEKRRNERKSNRRNRT